MKRRQRRALFTTGLSLVLAILLASCATAATSTTPHATGTPTPASNSSGARLHGTVTRTLRLADAPAACPVDAAWAPSGGQIAVLATRVTCLARPATKMPDLIVIYDAHSGAIDRQFSLASILSQEQALIMIEPRFGFSGLSWSPDGSKIVVPFLQYTIPTPGPGNTGLTMSSDPRGMGVLVISAQSGAVRALAGPANFGPSTTGMSPRYTGANVWDVRSGTQAATISLPLPAAQSYQWTANGQVVPAATPATTQAQSARFSYWQPGFIAAVPTNGQSAGDPVWFFSAATFTRWSPDSRYVVTDLMTMNQAGRSTGASSSIDPNMCHEERWPQPCFDQLIPTPDAAFQAVLATMKRAAETTHPYPNDAPVVWRRDDAVLATVLPGDDGSGAQRTLVITLLDTTSGAVLGTIPIPFQAAQGNIGMTRWPYFAWSPAGNQLAVVNAVDNTVEVVTIS
ncbi:MAG TPA: hypothetical protein VFN78_11365 [Ktedonobacterales bacterium]|nr:hypothetical protein [Ktedonobacterales bacterium]